MNHRRPLAAALVWSMTLALAAPALSGPPAAPAPRASTSTSNTSKTSASAPAKATAAPGAAAKAGASSTAGAVPSARPPTKDDIRRADELFAVGNKFMSARNYADACPAYEQAFRLDPTVNGAFNLADCHEALGRTATAYLDWLEVARLAKAKNKPDKLAKATERGNQLFVKLSTIEVKLQTQTMADSSVVVLVDDEPVDPAWLTTAHAIDPGTHFVEVRAAGKVTWRTKVLVAPEADRQVVAVPVLVAEAKDAPAPSAAPQALTAPPAKPVESPPLRDERRHSTILPGALTLGVGVVSLGFGGYMAMKSASTKSDAEATARANPGIGLDLSQARTQQTWARIGLGVGVLASGVGAYLILTSPKSSRTTALAPVVAPGFGGLSLVGRF
jgi:hypothetical protein